MGRGTNINPHFPHLDFDPSLIVSSGFQRYLDRLLEQSILLMVPLATIIELLNVKNIDKAM